MKRREKEQEILFKSDIKKIKKSGKNSVGREVEYRATNNRDDEEDFSLFFED
jgi:hypothetical protein